MLGNQRGDYKKKIDAFFFEGKKLMFVIKKYIKTDSVQLEIVKVKVIVTSVIIQYYFSILKFNNW